MKQAPLDDAKMEMEATLSTPHKSHTSENFHESHGLDTSARSVEDILNDATYATPVASSVASVASVKPTSPRKPPPSPSKKSAFVSVAASTIPGGGSPQSPPRRRSSKLQLESMCGTTVIGAVPPSPRKSQKANSRSSLTSSTEHADLVLDLDCPRHKNDSSFAPSTRERPSSPGKQRRSSSTRRPRRQSLSTFEPRPASLSHTAHVPHAFHSSLSNLHVAVAVVPATTTAARDSRSTSTVDHRNTSRSRRSRQSCSPSKRRTSLGAGAGAGAANVPSSPRTPPSHRRSASTMRSMERSASTTRSLQRMDGGPDPVDQPQQKAQPPKSPKPPKTPKTPRTKPPKASRTMLPTVTLDAGDDSRVASPIADPETALDATSQTVETVEHTVAPPTNKPTLELEANDSNTGDIDTSPANATTESEPVPKVDPVREAADVNEGSTPTIATTDSESATKVDPVRDAADVMDQGTSPTSATTERHEVTDTATTTTVDTENASVPSKDAASSEDGGGGDTPTADTACATRDPTVDAEVVSESLSPPQERRKSHADLARELEAAMAKVWAKFDDHQAARGLQAPLDDGPVHHRAKNWSQNRGMSMYNLADDVSIDGDVDDIEEEVLEEVLEDIEMSDDTVDPVVAASDDSQPAATTPSVEDPSDPKETSLKDHVEAKKLSPEATSKCETTDDEMTMSSGVYSNPMSYVEFTGMDNTAGHVDTTSPGKRADHWSLTEPVATTCPISAPNDSRLPFLPKLIVVDLWSTVESNVQAALEEFASLCASNANTEEFLKHGGHLSLMVVLRQWPMSATIQAAGLLALHKAANVMEFGDAAVQLGALDLVLVAMKNHSHNAHVLTAGCAALSNLTVSAAHAKTLVFELQGIPVVCAACAAFPINIALQKYAVYIIQYFSYWEDFKVPIVKAGGLQTLADMVDAISANQQPHENTESILKSARATMKRLV